MSYDVFPIFSSVVGTTKVKHDLTDFKKIIQNLDYHSTESEGSYNSYVSKDMFLLDSYMDVKDILLQEFNSFKNAVLRLETTQFDITTSWATKTLKEGYCQFHNHKNSFYSAVLYFEKSQHGSLTFNDVGINNSSFEVNEPVEYNIFNYRTFNVWPDNNLIVFFPSNMYHKINPHQDSFDRYSIAFNLIPVGEIGQGDSKMKIQKMTNEKI